MERLIELLDVSKLLTSFVEFLPQLIAAVVMFVVFVALFRVSRPAVRGVMNKAGLHEALVGLLVDSVYRYVLLIFGLVMALDQVGVNVAAALAGIGVAGIAIGFAAQDSIANVISGFLIFWDKPFIVGDFIEVEGQFGRVAHITLRTTRIRTQKNTYLVIPNKTIIDAVLENYSKHGEMRVDVVIGIAYKEDIGKARKAILDAVGGVGGVKVSPPPEVVVSDLADSSVNLSVRVWVDEAKDYNRTDFAVREAAKVALDDAGIQIPFPHLQLFVENVEDPVWQRAEKILAR